MNPDGAPGTSAGPPPRVLIAAVGPLLRAGYRAALGGDSGLHVVAEAADTMEVLHRARRLLPDVVLLDAEPPRLDAVPAAAGITNAGLPVRLLVLDGGTDDRTALDVLRAGATGLLDRAACAATLTAAARTVAAGQSVLPPALLGRLLAGPVEPVRRAQVHPGPLAALTEREREVFAQLARGLSNLEIARALSVSETTVKTHVGRVLTKLGLRDRVQAVVLAYQSGFIAPDSATARLGS